jgi:hypothetical protein
MTQVINRECSPASECGRAVSAPLRHIVPLGRRGYRRPETLAALHRRDALICDAVAMFFPSSSANGAAHRLHTALQRYESGAWRRERIADGCPSRHTGRIAGHCWEILHTVDHVPSARLIRAILARAGFRCQPAPLQCGPAKR